MKHFHLYEENGQPNGAIPAHRRRVNGWLDKAVVFLSTGSADSRLNSGVRERRCLVI